jgi:V-type H+-transporting ATPase subunit a
MIYINLNKCILRETFLDGEVWILSKNYENIKNILKNVCNKDDTRMKANIIDLIETNIPKPTYLTTNEFLWPFQEIVNTYGIPRYGEINPTFFNVVTFPFLFGVMFGDIGHGLFVFIFGAYICLFNNSLKTSMNSSFLKARYLILLMGFFAFYCGFLYNDFLSNPLPFFGTCYTNIQSSSIDTIYTNKTSNCVYPFGMDPKWYSASNQLNFFNSLKMKLSVTFGVIHMLGGILLKGLNEIHFGNWIEFIFEFIPQIIFMGILFGYMVVMIFIKWATDWTNNEQNAPSIITMMINIFLRFGDVVKYFILNRKINLFGVDFQMVYIHKKIFIN